MLSGGVIEYFDVIEYVLACLCLGPIDFSVDSFSLEQFEDALGDRFGMVLAAPAH